MAWVATTSFETTNGSTTPTDGNDIVGTGDGSGWSGSWTNVTNGTRVDYDDDAPSTPDGTWTAYANTTDNTEWNITRTVTTAVTSGRVSFKVRFVKENRNNPFFGLLDGANRKLYIAMNCATDGSGRTLVYNGGTIATGVFFKDTWYKVDIDFDVSTDTFDVYVDDVKQNGSALAFEATATQITVFQMRDSAASVAGSAAGNQYWIDEIEPYTASASGPASLKTRDTIQKSAIKSVDGVLIASVKSVDTIT